MAGNVLYGMAPCFGHTGVTFDTENDGSGLGSLRGHFEGARGRFFETEGFVDREATCGPPQELYSCFGHTGVTFDSKNDRPGPGSLRGHFYDARGYIFETEGFVGREATGGPPQELYRREAARYI